MSSGSMAYVAGAPARFEAPTLAHFLEIERGLPIAALDILAERVAPGDSSFRYRLVPKATLARRRGGDARLTPEESDKVIRLAKVFNFAAQVWGSDHLARRLMHEPNMLLEQRVPLDMILSSEVGAQLVEELIGQAKYGVAV